jgi:hypothetical protein
MIETTSHERTKARGHDIAVALAVVAALLWWGGGWGPIAQAQAPFEVPPVLQASELAPPICSRG